jgi:hypothetical protein
MGGNVKRRVVAAMRGMLFETAVFFRRLVHSMLAALLGIVLGTVIGTTVFLTGLVAVAFAQTGQLGPYQVWGNPTAVQAPGRGSTTSQITGPHGIVLADDFTTYSDFVHDDGAPLQAALNQAATNGGGTVYIGAKRYWSSTTNITVPKHVSLRCSISAQLNPGLNPQNTPCSIYLKAPYYVINNGEINSVNIFDDQVHFYSRAWTRASMQTFIAQFSRTGITIGTGTPNALLSDGAIVRNVLVGGFATCISVNAENHIKLENILGDCTNGLDISQSYDDNYLSHVEFWPFLTTNQAHTFDSWTISGMADNGAGAWRLTTSAAHDIVTGEQLWINTAATGQGLAGLYTMTNVDSTHVDVQGSLVTPTTTGDTTLSSTYVPVASTANISYGMGVSGAGIPAGASVRAIWRTRNAIQLDENHAATATAVGTALTFTSTAYVSGKTLSYDGSYRFGKGFRLGRADGTSCEACFAFGYLVGFDFNNGAGITFVNSQVDSLSHVANANAVPIGIEFTGTSGSGNKFFGNIITCSGVAIMSTVTGNPESYNNVVEGLKGGSAAGVATYLEVSSGGVSLIGHASGAAYNILLDETANKTILVGNTMTNTRIFGTGIDATWLGGGNLFGGNIALQAPSITSAQKVQATGGSSAGLPIVELYDGTQTTNYKYWRFATVGGSLAGQLVDDAYTTPTNWLTVTRTGNAPGIATFATAIDTGTRNITSAGVKVSAAAPDFQLYASGSGADQKYWDIIDGASGNLTIRSLNDAFSASNPAMLFARGSGYTINHTTLYTAAGVQAFNCDVAQHCQSGNATAPTIASGACGAATNGTVTGGNDMSFTFSIGAAATSACTVTFAGTWATAPKSCHLQPTNAAALVAGMYQSAISATAVTFTGTTEANTTWAAKCE